MYRFGSDGQGRYHNKTTDDINVHTHTHPTHPTHINPIATHPILLPSLATRVSHDCNRLSNHSMLNPLNSRVPTIDITHAPRSASRSCSASHLSLLASVRKRITDKSQHYIQKFWSRPAAGHGLQLSRSISVNYNVSLKLQVRPL